MEWSTTINISTTYSILLPNKELRARFWIQSFWTSPSSLEWTSSQRCLLAWILNSSFAHAENRFMNLHARGDQEETANLLIVVFTRSHRIYFNDVQRPSIRTANVGTGKIGRQSIHVSSRLKKSVLFQEQNDTQFLCIEEFLKTQSRKCVFSQHVTTHKLVPSMSGFISNQEIGFVSQIKIHCLFLQEAKEPNSAKHINTVSLGNPHN